MINGDKASGGLPTPPKDIPIIDPIPWLTLARSHYGQKEILGGVDNPFVVECFKYTTYPTKPFPHDEVPWCAAFVSRMLRESKQKDDNTAWAFDYKDYGKPSELKEGAVLVFKWTNGGGHVTFCDHIVDNDYVACLGGNQDNMVKISNYARKYLVACRWPVPLLETVKT